MIITIPIDNATLPEIDVWETGTMNDGGDFVTYRNELIPKVIAAVNDKTQTVKCYVDCAVGECNGKLTSYVCDERIPILMINSVLNEICSDGDAYVNGIGTESHGIKSGDRGRYWSVVVNAVGNEFQIYLTMHAEESRDIDSLLTEYGTVS